MSHQDDEHCQASVAMCTYNGARFLPAQLNSILAQTRQPDELVIQDDGSPDNTLGIVERFAAEAPFPVRFEINRDRLGPARNFATCMARCRGQVIILTDQDDVWFPDRVERTLAAHRNPEVAFTFSDAPLIDEAGELLGRTIFDTVPVRFADRVRLAAGDDLLPLILRYGVLYGTTLSARSDTMRKALPLPSGWSHDEWLTLVCAALGASRRLEPVTQYRQHAGQVVGAGVAGIQAVMIGARHHSRSFYEEELARYVAAQAHPALEQEPLTTRLLPQIKAKLAFLRARRIIHDGGFAGFAALLSQLRQGNYHRFASGPRSIAKDVAIAGRATAWRT